MVSNSLRMQPPPSAHNLGAQQPCVSVQGLWQEVLNQRQHQQKHEGCVWQASYQEKLLQILYVGQGGGGAGKGRFWAAPGRQHTSPTISIEHLLCWFFIYYKTNCLMSIFWLFSLIFEVICPVCRRHISWMFIYTNTFFFFFIKIKKI